MKYIQEKLNDILSKYEDDAGAGNYNLTRLVRFDHKEKKAVRYEIIDEIKDFFESNNIDYKMSFLRVYNDHWNNNFLSLNIAYLDGENGENGENLELKSVTVESPYTADSEEIVAPIIFDGTKDILERNNYLNRDKCNINNIWDELEKKNLKFSLSFDTSKNPYEYDTLSIARLDESNTIQLGSVVIIHK